MNLRDEVTMRQAAGEPFPCPPFPAPDDPALLFVINDAIRSYRNGSATAEQAIKHVAVHAWYEGHLFAVDGPVDPAVFTAPLG